MASHRPSLAKPRALAFHFQQGRCFYCGQPMCNGDLEAFAQRHHLTKKVAKRFQCTGEHLTPHKDGGSSSASNIVAACYFCNHKRHARKKELSPSEYRAFVERRMSKGGWHSARIARHVPNREQGLMRHS